MEMAASTVILSETKKACSRSSLKGLPRSVTSEKCGIRWFWRAGVALLLVITSLQVGYLVKEYLQYDVVTSATEIPVNSKMKPPLPFLTICSTNPIRSSARWPDSAMTVEQYFRKLNEMFQCENCSTETKTMMSRLRNSMKSTEGYFQNVGVQEAFQLSHQRDPFIALCRLQVASGTRRISIPCVENQNIVIKTQIMPSFFNCYDIKPKIEKVGSLGWVIGMELMLYLDNQWNTTHHSGFHSEGSSTGAVVMVTEKGATEATLMQLQGTFIPAGNDVMMNVNSGLRSREKDPYGNCVTYGEDGKIFSQMHCFSECLIGFIEEECNCSEPTTVVSLDTTVSSNTSYCLNISLPIEQALRNIMCRESSRLNHQMDCITMCPMSCLENHYDIETQTTTWPLAPHLTFLYDEILHQEPFSSSFSHVKDLIDESCSPEDECQYMIARLIRKLQANFSRLSYKVTNNFFFHLKDSPKMSLIDLLSKLGGALNLWSGITVVVLLELIELCINIARLSGAKEGESEPILKDESKGGKEDVK